MATRFFLISLFLFFSHPALALDQESFAMCISKLRQAGLEAGLPAQVISQHLITTPGQRRTIKRRSLLRQISMQFYIRA